MAKSKSIALSIHIFVHIKSLCCTAADVICERPLRLLRLHPLLLYLWRENFEVLVHQRTSKSLYWYHLKTRSSEIKARSWCPFRVKKQVSYGHSDHKGSHIGYLCESCQAFQPPGLKECVWKQKERPSFEIKPCSVCIAVGVRGISTKVAARAIWSQDCTVWVTQDLISYEARCRHKINKNCYYYICLMNSCTWKWSWP